MGTYPSVCASLGHNTIPSLNFAIAVIMIAQHSHCTGIIFLIFCTAVCVDGGTSTSLNKAQLEMILDTVYPVTGNPVPFANIITPDRGTTVYSHELSPLSAYQGLLEGTTETGNIWSSYTPCPSCARALLAHYDKADVEKPTIHVARIYSESSKMTHIVESFQCLARLIHEGFAIVPWDFNAFKTLNGIPMFVDDCTSVIDAYYGDSNFTSAYMELVSHVTFIQELGQNSHANSWCES